MRAIAQAFKDSYNIESSGCLDIFERFLLDVIVVSQEIAVNPDTASSTLWITFRAVVRCSACPDDGPLFTSGGSVATIDDQQPRTSINLHGFAVRFVNLVQATAFADSTALVVIELVEVGLDGKGGMKIVLPSSSPSLLPTIFDSQLNPNDSNVPSEIVAHPSSLPSGRSQVHKLLLLHTSWLFLHHLPQPP